MARSWPRLRATQNGAMPNGAKLLRKRAGLTLERAAELSGVSVSQISRIERGVSGYSAKSVGRLAAAYGVSEAEIFDEAPPMDVPLVGRVQGGGAVMRAEAAAGEAELVTRPPEHAGPLAAVRVEGNSMLPVYEPGDLLYFAPGGGAPIEGLVGKVCVCQAADGRLLVKRIRRGSRPGAWDLDSHNAATLADVGLEWASPVLWVKKA